MEWGLTRYGAGRHILAEAFTPLSTYAGIALCGILLAQKIMNPMNLKSWSLCQKCETLLSAMESV